MYGKYTLGETMAKFIGEMYVNIPVTWCIRVYISGQTTILPKSDLLGHLGEMPLLSPPCKG